MAIITYEHHETKVFVDERLKGKHRENCLCWKCDSFKPGTPQNCPKAQKLYRICVDEGMTTPVFECPAYIGPRFTAPQGSDCFYCDSGVPHTHTGIPKQP